MPVLSLIAVDGTGMTELAAMLERHAAHLAGTAEGTDRRRRRAAAGVQAVVLENVESILGSADGRARMVAAADEVAAGRADHHRAAAAVVDWLAGRMSQG